MLTAIVQKVTTCHKYLPDNPAIDVLQLSYDGKAYFVESKEIDRYRIGQEVEVAVVGGFNRWGSPHHLGLVE